jgi:hypothetical protein
MKEESYHYSRKSIDRSIFNSDNKIKVEDDGLNKDDKWVEDIADNEGAVIHHVAGEEDPDSHDDSMKLINQNEADDYFKDKPDDEKPAVLNSKPSKDIKGNLDNIEEKDQNYIDFDTNTNKPSEVVNTKGNKTKELKEDVDSKPIPIHKIKSQNDITTKKLDLIDKTRDEKKKTFGGINNNNINSTTGFSKKASQKQQPVATSTSPEIKKRQSFAQLGSGKDIEVIKKFKIRKQA